jgi:hypothetical protein
MIRCVRSASSSEGTSCRSDRIGIETFLRTFMDRRSADARPSSPLFQYNIKDIFITFGEGRALLNTANGISCLLRI